MEHLQYAAAISVIMYCAANFVFAVRADHIRVKRYDLERERFLAEQQRLYEEHEFFEEHRRVASSDPPSYGANGMASQG